MDQATGGFEAQRQGGGRIPDLGPRGVRNYRVVWVLLLLIAIGANAAAPYFNNQMREQTQKPFSELGLRQWNGRTVQVPHRPSLERAGVVAGSEIVAIGGKPVPADAPIEAVAQTLAAQPDPAIVTIRSPEGTERTFRLARSPQWIELSYVGTGLTSEMRMTIDLALAGLANLSLILASALLFWRRPRDGLAVLLSFAFLGFAAFENLTYFTWLQLGLIDISRYLFDLAFVALFIGLMLCPDGLFQPHWSRWVAVAMVAGGVTSVALEQVASPEWLRILLFVGPALLVLPAMRSRFKRTPVGTEAWQQQRWLLLGMSLSAVAMVITFVISNLANSTLLSRQQLVWAYLSSGLTLSLVPLCIAGGMLVALLRYRLYDADAVLSRSAGLALIGLTFAALFAGFAKAIEIGIEQVSGGSAGAVPGIAAAVLATVVITPAQSRIQQWTDDRFRKALAHLRRDLPACVDDLRETASLDELLDEVLGRVTRGVQARSAAVAVDGEIIAQRGANDEDWPLRLPLRIAHGEGDSAHVGELLVGTRPDGSLPSRDEREALEEVLDPVSRAIRIVRTRQAREERDAERWAALEQRIARLESKALA